MRVVLTTKQEIAVIRYLEAEYTKSGLSDPDFAKKAAEELKIAMNRTHIERLRIALDIPSNIIRGASQTAKGNAAVDARFVELDSTIVALSCRLDDCVRKIETLQRDMLHSKRAI